MQQPCWSPLLCRRPDTGDEREGVHRANVLFVTREYHFNLDVGFTAGSQTVRCLCPITDIFQLKMNRAYAHCMWLILSYEIEFSTLFFLIRAAHTFDFKSSYNLNTGGDQWRMTETYVFDRTSIFLCKLCLMIRYLHPRCQGQSFTPASALTIAHECAAAGLNSNTTS